MPDLRALLHEAAGDPPDLPDVETIMARARPHIIRRRVAAGATALVVGVAGWAATNSLLTDPESARIAGDHQPGPDSAADEPVREGLLEPDTYSTKVGAYDVSLETHDDAWAAVVVEPEWLALTFRQYVLHLQVWDGVVPPAAEDSATQAPPADLATWLAQHPRLSTGSPVQVEVGDLPATQIDVRVVRPLTSTPPECTSRCAILARVAGDDELVDLEVGQHARFFVIGPPGDELVVFYRAPEKEFAVLDEAVATLLAELRLETSD